MQYCDFVIDARCVLFRVYVIGYDDVVDPEQLAEHTMLFSTIVKFKYVLLFELPSSKNSIIK